LLDIKYTKIVQEKQRDNGISSVDSGILLKFFYKITK